MGYVQMEHRNGMGQILTSISPAIQAAGGGTAAAGAAAWAMPIAGAVLTVGTFIYGWIKRRNAQKVAATFVVDEAEPLLEQNREAFLSLPNPTATDRRAALAYFDAVWGQVVKECRAIGGGGGERCVSDRSPGGPWDWFAYYRTPIEQADVASTPGGSFGIPGTDLSIPLPLVAGAALLIVGASL